MSYEIKKNNLIFDDMNTRKWTRRLVIHHAAAIKCSVEDIHRWHKENGWSGMGYHFLVRKDGSIWEGRPIDKVGAHAYGYNNDSIGICFEGNFEKEKMSTEQKNAGKWLVSYVRKLYPTITTIQRHKDLMATACPGRNFPFSEIKEGVVTKQGYTGTFPNIKVAYTVDGTKKYRNYLKQGDKGTQVRNLQRLLNWLGYKLDVDGDFGPLTRSAVMQFQKKYKLDVDGLFGEKSLAKAKSIKK